tara:strand:+ start:5381 stop:6046 length:666 start_codon:yes stop_codon:yes gene_type:complete
MFGLEGSGFILSIGLTLLIAGTIVFYVNNKFKETAEQLQTVLQIVQQVNSSKNSPPPMARHVPTPPVHENGNSIVIQKDNLINVSDDENDDDSDVSSTTDTDSDDDNKELLDEGNVNDNKNIVVNLDTVQIDGEVCEKPVTEESDEESEESETKKVDIDNATGGELDTMLLNIIDIHKSTTSNVSLQDMKVTDLRDLIKERGIKVPNLGKLKKNECIELLS